MSLRDRKAIERIGLIGAEEIVTTHETIEYRIKFLKTLMPYEKEQAEEIKNEIKNLTFALEHFNRLRTQLIMKPCALCGRPLGERAPTMNVWSVSDERDDLHPSCFNFLDTILKGARFSWSDEEIDYGIDKIRSIIKLKRETKMGRRRIAEELELTPYEVRCVLDNLELINIKIKKTSGRKKYSNRLKVRQ